MASSSLKTTHCATCGRFSPIYQCRACRHFYMTVNSNIEFLQIYCSKVCLEAGSNSHASLCSARKQMLHTALLLRNIYTAVRKITFDLDVIAVDKDVADGVYSIKHHPLEGGKILAAYPDQLRMTSEGEEALLGHGGATMAMTVFGTLLDKLLTGAVVEYGREVGHNQSVMELDITLAKPKTTAVSVNESGETKAAVPATIKAAHSVFRVHFMDDVTYTIDLTSRYPLMLWKRYEEEFVLKLTPLEKFRPKSSFTEPAMPLGTTLARLGASQEAGGPLDDGIARRVKAEMLTHVRDEVERCVGEWEVENGRELKSFLREVDFCDDHSPEQAFPAMKRDLVGRVGTSVAALVRKGKMEMGWSYQESYDELAERLGVLSFGSDEEME